MRASRLTLRSAPPDAAGVDTFARGHGLALDHASHGLQVGAGHAFHRDCFRDARPQSLAPERDADADHDHGTRTLGHRRRWTRPDCHHGTVHRSHDLDLGGGARDFGCASAQLRPILDRSRLHARRSRRLVGAHLVLQLWHRQRHRASEAHVEHGLRRTDIGRERPARGLRACDFDLRAQHVGLPSLAAGIARSRGSHELPRQGELFIEDPHHLATLAQHQECALCCERNIQPDAIDFRLGAPRVCLRCAPALRTDIGEREPLFDGDAPIEASIPLCLVHRLEWIVVDRRRDHGILECAGDGWTLRRGTGARHGRDDLRTPLFRDPYDICEAKRRAQFLRACLSTPHASGRDRRSQQREQ
jgi:hypothetical protein